MQSIQPLILFYITIAKRLQPLALLLFRLAIAHVFITSGLVKISDFSNTVALFQSEYQVPLLPPYFAAISATFFELTCPVLLILGFATRFAVLPLLAMTAVIQFTYDQNPQHAFWALLLFGLLAFGGGRWSLDHLIKRKVANESA